MNVKKRIKTDPVQAVAEALHADQCPDDDCEGGDLGEYDRIAEVAIAAARPVIERDAMAAALREAADALHDPTCLGCSGDDEVAVMADWLRERADKRFPDRPEEDSDG